MSARCLFNYALFFICIPFLTIPTLSASEVHTSKILSHDIEIELYPKEHKLNAKDRIQVQCADSEKISFFINDSFDVLSVGTPDKKLDFNAKNKMSWDINSDRSKGFGDVQYVEVVLPHDLMQLTTIALDVVYEGLILSKPSSIKEEDVGETVGIVDERGVYLSPACFWYPDVPDSLSTFKAKVITPNGYEAVTQGKLVKKDIVKDKLYTTWEEKNVSEGCHLIAGKYMVKDIKVNGINIYTYFFPEEQGLSEIYLGAARRYLEMYQRLLGEYPYDKFAVVENFFQTGYGMPSFTLLGNYVIKLPFIVETSLGHEILHNWWGNSVFVDEREGNWCEGLTTYMADYYYKELSDKTSAQDYRRDICRKYTNYVTEKNDFPLNSFVGRRDQVTQSVGYGKTAMVFHMLRKIVGDDLFFKSLRKFYKEKIWQSAGWTDIKNVFESECNMNLSWFFGQWINRTGAPFIDFGGVNMRQVDDGWLTELEIIQTYSKVQREIDSPYRFHLPIILELQNECDYKIVEVNESSNVVSFKSKSKPASITLDPEYDVFRRLHIEEVPPSIDSVLGDSKGIIVYPTECESSSVAAYKKFAEFLADGKKIIKADKEVTETDIAEKSLFVLGGVLENKLTKKFIKILPENLIIRENEFTINEVKYSKKSNILLVIFRNPENKLKNIALFLSLGTDNIVDTGYKIKHYGKYSYLVFDGSKNIDKGVFKVVYNPLKRYFSE
ncbi:MAG TPA: M1 family metallopeptidase [Candidatus Wujingus californicus]|uniref:M1 family metallopeptidase n=2 Tax=Candidatus Wujingus californicus TaxID=3367618 RepID=UPI001D26C908|nr:hypothetical protein [Planctomycetota bacterium]MDO8130547.1 M1 family aminopeptidase [Candidatus Brocadiales bacterium]